MASRKSYDEVNDSISNGDSDDYSISSNDEDSMSSTDGDDTDALVDDSSKTKKGTRGPVQMHRIMKLRQKGEKVKLGFDGKRDTEDELQSYIGRLVREHVPIDINNWKKVPKAIKDRIWAEVKETFIIDDKRKKKQLCGAGTKWRKWKSLIYTNYVENKFPLLRPPKVRRLYKRITKKQWENFVRYRKTLEFQKLSAEQSARRKTFKYDHHMSRKGYKKLEREMQQERGVKGKIDRADKWLRARQNKKGEYHNKAVQSVADKIDSYKERVKKGTFKPEGKNDVLSAALETPEHDGRVRGESQFVTQKECFEGCQSRKNYKRDAEMDDLRAQIEYLTTIVVKLQQKEGNTQANDASDVEALNKDPKDIVEKLSINTDECETDLDEMEVASKQKQILKKAPNLSSGVNDQFASQGDPNPSIDMLGKGTPCLLCSPSLDDIVAKGKAFLLCGPDSLIHGRKLGENNLRFSVDCVEKPEERLPITTDEFEIVMDACGGHVSWPANLVSFDMEAASKQTKSLKKAIPSLSSGINEHAASEEDLNPSIDTLGKGTSCLLCFPTLDDIVAEGKAYMLCGPNSLLHGKRLGENTLRVSIDVVKKPKSKLPISTDEFRTVIDAYGGHVAWPANLISFDIQADSKSKKHLAKSPPLINSPKKKKAKRNTKEQASAEVGKPTTMQIDQTMFKCNLTKDKTMEQEKMGKGIKTTVISLTQSRVEHELLPPIVQYAENQMNVETLIKVRMPNSIGLEPIIYLDKVDILQFAAMVEISAACISVYIKYLHSHCSRNGLLKRFSFVDPSFISPAPKIRNDSTERQRADIVLRVLNQASKDQLILLPYNIGRHWMLVVINPWNDEIFWIDPLGHEARTDIKQVMRMALCDFKLQHKGVKFSKKDGSTKWTLIQAPRQPGSVECGFYILRYMRDIIEYDWPIGKIPTNFGGINKYTSQDIEEVQKEWATVVQRMIWPKKK